MKVVVAYDISSAAVRNRVISALQAYGFRVQLSVFECTVSRSQKRVLQERLTSILDAGTSTDSIRMYIVADCRVIGDQSAQVSADLIF